VGENALYRDTGGNFNTATGDAALFTNGIGNWNTANGAGALVYNSNGDHNTALGALALFSNTTASDNTAIGYEALFHAQTAQRNVAVGSQSLFTNVTGEDNTAIGFMALLNGAATYENTAVGSYALYSNGGSSVGLSAIQNTAVGYTALFSNKQGNTNTAIGGEALRNHVSGDENTAIGRSALEINQFASHNTAIGQEALLYCTGDDNIGVGDLAGIQLTSGAHNIDVGNLGTAGESGTIRIGTQTDQTATYIAGIYGQTASGGTAVYIDNTGHLGTMTSSARYKEAITPMARVSEAILALQPITFHYKKNIDPARVPQFGLVAEEVEKVNPSLVIHDDQGKPYTVRYEAVNAMLLNEFLKEHRKVEEQGMTISRLESLVAKQENAIKALTASVREQAGQIQKVSAQLAAKSPAPRLVWNGR
jgi:uncharacterized coiled-coil protein SlyX